MYLRGQCLHGGVLVDQELVLLGELPVELVPHPHVDREVLRIKPILGQLDGDLPFFNDLLLLHGFLPVDLAHLVIHLLPDPNPLPQQLHSLHPVEDGEEELLDFAGPEVGVDRDVGDELEFMESVVGLLGCVAGQEQLDAHLSHPGWDPLLQVEGGAADEAVLLEGSLSVLELQP